uniref:glycosyltransferase family 2 protein n=1 Tax=Pannonibacter phragmitetus TaxID=121719 RepID=UPI000B970518|nr:glycosyltransferase family 2 protein [Pannonibacter phragmitetus]
MAVTFNPDASLFRRLLLAIRPQVDHVIVVDNTPGGNLLEGLQEMTAFVELISLGDNLGIARAQNIGIARAGELKSDYVLLLDQDSIPESFMVQKLISAINEKKARGIKVACAGPNYRDARQVDAKPFVRLSGFSLSRYSCSNEEEIIQVYFIIASGCLIPIDVIESVGGMTEELFIDYVDIEWGLRAASQGYLSFGVCSASMEHSLGDATIAFGRRQVPLHSPLRHYYAARNAMWLCRRPWLSMPWRVALIKRVLLQVIFFSLFSPARLRHSSMLLLGILHGLIGRMGKRQ